MHSSRIHLLATAALFFSGVGARTQGVPDARLWLTTVDRSSLLAMQAAPLRFAESTNPVPAIQVNDMEQYQPIEGFGFALTGGSAQLLMRMRPEKRTELLKELFAPQGDGIHVSYLRVSIGSSDMNDHVYSYDDTPPGQVDPSLAKFSLDPDRADVIPVLREILTIAPGIPILGSPWSAPAWMKTNDDVKAGHLKPEYDAAYAQYFVKVG